MCASQINQLIGILLIHRQSLRLYIRSEIPSDIRSFIMMQTDFLHGIVYDFDSAFHVTFLIGILDTQNKISVLMLGNQIFEQCCSQISDVHIPGRTWCKSCSYFFHTGLPFHLLVSIYSSSLAFPHRVLPRNKTKKSPKRLSFFIGWGTWIRTKEMPDSESGALPLGYTPISQRQRHYSTCFPCFCQ